MVVKQHVVMSTLVMVHVKRFFFSKAYCLENKIPQPPSQGLASPAWGRWEERPWERLIFSPCKHSHVTDVFNGYRLSQGH